MVWVLQAKSHQLAHPSRVSQGGLSFSLFLILFVHFLLLRAFVPFLSKIISYRVEL
jgi:hypothetical protein